MKSPGVRIREYDKTNFIRGSSDTSAVIIIKEPWKGEEFKAHFTESTDDLVDRYGKPTSRSKIDMLSADGYLKHAISLYSSCVRPEDATFSAIQIKEGYNESDYYEEMESRFTYDASGSVDSDEEDGPYDYDSLGTKDIDEFADITESMIMDSGNPLWFISKWRGKSSKNIRVMLYDYEIFKGIRYFDEDDEEVNMPSDMDITDEAKDYIENTAYPAYKDDPSDTQLYPNVRNNLDKVLSNDYQFGIIIQEKSQDDIWETKETYVASTDERDFSDTGEVLFVESLINQSSDIVRVSLNENYRTDNDVDNGPIKIVTSEFVQLQGGNDGKWGRHSDTSYDEAVTGAFTDVFDEIYSNPEEIDFSIFIDSGNNEDIKRKIIELCEERKDSFAILDVKKGDVVNNKGNEVRDLIRWRTGRSGNTFNPNSSYAALYANWLEVYNKWNRRYEWIPASGYVAGIYARSDRQGELWFSPAGLNRAVLSGVRKLAWNPGKGARDQLYPEQINPIVSFSGQGKVIWGNRTLLNKGSAFQSINIRRLFIHMRKNVTKAARNYVFEQIDDITFTNIRNEIEPLLKSIRSRRGIEKYEIVFEGLNTSETRIKGELWGNIFVVPVGVAEFIYLDFIATKSGVDFTEISVSE